MARALKEKKEPSKWAGTELDGETAYVYYYFANELSKDKILKYSKSLFGWEQPMLPEDLSFYKSENPWLVSIAHMKLIGGENKRTSHMFRGGRGVKHLPFKRRCYCKKG
ncbi:hypothetical protein ABET14_12820 [Heyndrickxia coagulans]|uniref:hypothetical protein n=1 Tax=Heyndrickxia coagulans TaxID=1398 RepID=UPI003D249102